MGLGWCTARCTLSPALCARREGAARKPYQKRGNPHPRGALGELPLNWSRVGVIGTKTWTPLHHSIMSEGRLSIIHELEALARDASRTIVTESGLSVADVPVLCRGTESIGRDGTIVHNAKHTIVSGARTIASRRLLAQLWSVICEIHASLLSGSKMTQRELWYRLKVCGLFTSPKQVSERVVDVCFALAYRRGVAVPRESLGIIAAPRGSMAGCITLLQHEVAAAQPLDNSVWQVPGDTEAIRSLRVAADDRRARCVLVVEKDSVFRRLIDDRFTSRLPCVLITACGFPDLATRALVQHISNELGVPSFCLTDYNPHGILLMLTYKHGSESRGLESDCRCPSLRWIGLHSAHVRSSSTESDDPVAVEISLPADSYQPFSKRDKSVLTSLSQRTAISASAHLRREVELMGCNAFKVEIEALYCHGFAFLSQFIARRIEDELSCISERPSDQPGCSSEPAGWDRGLGAEGEMDASELMIDEDDSQQVREGSLDHDDHDEAGSDGASGEETRGGWDDDDEEFWNMSGSSSDW
jgi:meiotic recombination protein SPO11